MNFGDSEPRKEGGRVAVVIPAYNHGAYIREAIESALGQGSIVNEVVVIDDGSKDDTAAAARAVAAIDPRVVVESKPNSGPSPTRNVGWRRTRSEWIYFLDADDALCPGALEALLRAVDQHGSRAIPYGNQEVYAKVLSGKPAMVAHLSRRSGCILRDIACGYTGTIWTSLVPRDWVEAIGGFNESDGIWRGEDFDYGLQLAVRYPFLWVDRPVVKTRMHDSNRHRAFGSEASLGHIRSIDRAFLGSMNPVHRWYARLGRAYYYMEQAHALLDEGEPGKARAAFGRAWLWAPHRLGNLRQWLMLWLGRGDRHPPRAHVLSASMDAKGK